MIESWYLISFSTSVSFSCFRPLIFEPDNGRRCGSLASEQACSSVAPQLTHIRGFRPTIPSLNSFNIRPTVICFGAIPGLYDRPCELDLVVSLVLAEMAPSLGRQRKNPVCLRAQSPSSVRLVLISTASSSSFSGLMSTSTTASGEGIAEDGNRRMAALDDNDRNGIDLE